MKIMLNSFGRMIGVAALLSAISGGATYADQALLGRPEVVSLMDELVQQHNFDHQTLTALFRKVELRPSIIEAIMRPAEAKPWHQYRPIFVTESRIRQGVEFWDKHAADLTRASDAYGVPPEIIVAILGVETRYGRYAGKHRVIDALATLAFDYPQRSAFFRKELLEYLLLTREEGMDPLALKGSYAGAMGKPQFISSSYRHYAVDFDGDGVRDLLNSTVDAIGSVANYFQRHQWRHGEPVVSRAQAQGEQYRQLVELGIKPHIEASRVTAYGVRVENDVPGLLGALIELETEQGSELWFGYQNFYVITRYNHSPLYAMAVYQLGQAIRQQRQAQQARAD